MSKSALQINAEYVVARILLAGFRMLPMRAALFIGSRLGGSAYYLSGRLRRTGERNLKLAFPKLTDNEQGRLLRECFRNLGRLLGVFSQFPKAGKQQFQSLFDVEGLEHLETARRKEHGIILFTGHIGAWELSSFGLSLRGHPLSFLVRRIDNPKIEMMIDRWRQSSGRSFWR